MNSDETISIMCEEVPARHDLIEIDGLHFLPDNPRVYAAIRDMADFNELTPEEKDARVYEQLLQEPSVSNLIPEIKRDGGLQEAVIVRWDTRQVIEGNSRLAAYRKLYEGSKDIRWAKIKCQIVAKLTDDQQTRLLGQAHLHGRTEWSPYAKALHCFRWVEEEQRDIDTLCKLCGITRAEIKKRVLIIQHMKDNHDDKQTHFSYYEVLVRKKVISSAVENSDILRDLLLEQIKREAFTAQEMRDRLPTVIKKPRMLRKYEKGEVTLDDAYMRAKVNRTEEGLRNARKLLDDIEQSDVADLELAEIGSVKQVLRQIQQGLTRVSNMIDAASSAKTTPKANLSKT